MSISVFTKQRCLRILNEDVTFSIEAPVISLVFMFELLRNLNVMKLHQYSMRRLSVSHVHGKKNHLSPNYSEEYFLSLTALSLLTIRNIYSV